jgi:hypothetical protein
MVRGKKNYVENNMNVALGLTSDNFIMSGPLEAISKHCSKYVEVIQGSEKVSSVAKLIKKILGSGDLDEIVRSLPPGGCRLKKQ